MSCFFAPAAGFSQTYDLAFQKHTRTHLIITVLLQLVVDSVSTTVYTAVTHIGTCSGQWSHSSGGLFGHLNLTKTLRRLGHAAMARQHTAPERQRHCPASLNLVPNIPTTRSLWWVIPQLPPPPLMGRTISQVLQLVSTT